MEKAFWITFALMILLSIERWFLLVELVFGGLTLLELVCIVAWVCSIILLFIFLAIALVQSVVVW